MSDRAIWKCPLHPGRNRIEAPHGTRWLSVGLDGRGEPCLYGLVHPDQPTGEYVFRVVMTGERCEVGGLFVGTFTRGPFVGHVFGPEETSDAT